MKDKIKLLESILNEETAKRSEVCCDCKKEKAKYCYNCLCEHVNSTH